VKSIDEIWAGDLLGRREEAEQLIRYLENSAMRNADREDKRSLSISVDAPYGIGKTFFLKRLAETLAEHPVAYVDAWADDLQDEPLTALAATLKAALDPLLEKPAFSAKFAAFMKTTGKVASIVSQGLLKRGLSLLITTGNAEAVGNTIAGFEETVKDAFEEGSQNIADGLIDDTTKAIKSVTAHSLMEARVKAFEDGRSAIAEMKQSLSALVEAIAESELKSPIVIIIDELDRCRPNYAIKLLEEVKHLFDVPGLVFIFGTHSQQLAHSVSAAYGANFNGRDYLQRFFDREYHLSEPELEPLLAVLCRQAGLANQFSYWRVWQPDHRDNRVELPTMLSLYFDAFGLTARDAFRVVDHLSAAASLVPQSNSLLLGYLMPLLVGRMRGMDKGAAAHVRPATKWKFVIPKDRFGQEPPLYFHPDQVADRFVQAVSMPDEQLQENAEKPEQIGAQAVYRTRDWNSTIQPLFNPIRYPDLIDALTRYASGGEASG
jgi:hypothetical protein